MAVLGKLGTILYACYQRVVIATNTPECWVI